MDSIYTYKPLSQAAKQRTRIILLHPSISTQAPLRCSLVQVDLGKNARYKALSYSWDAQKPSKPIICNGRMLFITPNCESALLQLRRNTKYQSLWIDSISIDQTSVKERNEQVSIMAKIYKQATTVIVWLGEGNVCSDRIFAFFIEFDTKRPRDTPLPPPFITWLLEQLREIDDSKTSLPI